MDIQIEDVVANSFRNFHAKGLDYLCLMRSPDLTIKVYFFDEAPEHTSEVVAPHDHRYDFQTEVLAGELRNFRYKYTRGSAYNLFDYSTPLLGGSGFVHKGTCNLKCVSNERYAVGQVHSHRAEELHTIKVRHDTVIQLQQYNDVVPVGQPTQLFMPADRDTPTLDGLYDRMDADYAIKRLNEWADLTGTIIRLG